MHASLELHSHCHQLEWHSKYENPCKQDLENLMYQDSVSWKNISPPVNINKLIYNVPSNLTKPFIVLASKPIG